MFESFRAYEDNDTEPDTTNGDKNYELKQKSVIFDSKKCKMIIIRDVSELAKLEYARSIEKISDIMIASTSHDMRTPLNTVINMHGLIKNTTQDKNIHKWLKVASNSTNLLLFLVNDTLDFYQIKSNKFTPRNCSFSFREIVEFSFDLIEM